ncbi:MAG TPA: single-stranded DNA-binding protein [Acidimicrobiales bacterium]|nr:single-stranded DNA-binding protein [Acidimicrobiales bacterium]
MNSIQLIGRLTAKPELRFTNGGTATCTIRLAVPRRRRKGEAEAAPVYVNVVTYGAQAEAVAQYLDKGRRVSVSGRLEYREWTTDDVRHSIHEVVASQVEFLDAAPKDPSDVEGDEPAYAPGEEPF